MQLRTIRPFSSAHKTHTPPMPPVKPNPSKTLRLLVVCPSWVGDAVMATPALRMIRRSMPGIFIGLLCKPGIDEVLAGLDTHDEIHVARPSGVMGPKFIAAKVRPRRYDTALLLTNSFSTALIARIAGIPRRIGYDRDARGMLLTDRLHAPKRADGSWAPIPACLYYHRAACALLSIDGHDAEYLPADAQLELAVTPEQQRAAEEILASAGVEPGGRVAILNPGGNNPAKRWPPDRFARVAERLIEKHGMRVLVNGAPGERDVISAVINGVREPLRDRCAALCDMGVNLGSLKGIVRRCSIMVTNDTGPRHIAGAFGVKLVTLFGPTDHRWTTIPTRPGGEELVLVADPSLPTDETANDHPERCRIERITTESVIAGVDALIAAREGGS
ncbi:MAG: glycosyltransferase family 9 protein [Phycisphaeraceae bacterium]|nr:glycosyltransferase family 9 protein [Phycisphaeraceae bacterium]